VPPTNVLECTPSRVDVIMPLRRDARTRPESNVADRVEGASADSFPASDPPGWIEGVARP
jgi:hypothetical protein